MTFHAHTLPDFPWDTLVPARHKAAEHPQGALDLTVGSPVDPTPQLALEALSASADAHGYPPTLGTESLRSAIINWTRRRRSVNGDVDIMLSIGSKETVALLPSLLGFGRGDRIGFPSIAYPTYDVGTRLAGAEPVALDPAADPETWPQDLAMVWLNSPSNPDGHVLSVAQLRKIVAWAQAHGVVVASDECYAELCWDVDYAPSVLADEVCDGNTRGLLMLYSLSKQSNMAGYRAAFMVGDPELVAPVLEIRKHAGFMLPSPVQHAMALMLDDDTHVAEQAARYRVRREKLLAALESAGLVNDPDNVAGLYLWAGEDPARAAAAGRDVVDAWALVNALAELGIIVAPGTFYGAAGANRIRMSLTASDQVIDQAVERLADLPQTLARHVEKL